MSTPADLTSIKNASKLINERLSAQGFFPIQSSSKGHKSSNNKTTDPTGKKLDKLYFPSIDWKDVIKPSVDKIGQPDDENTELQISGPTDVMYENDKKVLNVIYSLLDSIEMSRDLKESVVTQAQDQQNNIDRLESKVNHLLKVIEEKNKEIHSLHASNIRLENDAQIMAMKSKNALNKYLKSERDFNAYKDFTIREARRTKIETERQLKKASYLVSRHHHKSPNVSTTASSDLYETPANVTKKRKLPLGEVSNLRNKENIQRSSGPPSSSASSSEGIKLLSVPQNDPQLMASFAHLQDINSSLTHEMAKMYCWVLKVHELLCSWNNKLSDDGGETDKDNTIFRLSKSKKNLLERLSTGDHSTMDSFTTQDYLVTVPNSFVPLNDSDILTFDSRSFELSKIDKMFINILNQLGTQLFDVKKIANNGAVSKNNVINLSNVLSDGDGDTFLIKSKKRSNKDDQELSNMIKTLEMENFELKKNYEQAMKTMNEWKTFRMEKV